MINNILYYLALTIWVSPLQGGLHGFYGAWLRCNSLEWSGHSASLRLAPTPKTARSAPSNCRI